MSESNATIGKGPDAIPFYRELIRGLGKDITPLRTAVVNPIDNNSLPGARRHSPSYEHVYPDL